MEKAELLQNIAELCQQLYAQCGRMIVPKYPWVLVKVLPKQQESHGLLLPETQNKVIYEGLVLATWSPFWRHFRTNSGLTTECHVQSEFKVGDHVLFPHYEGLPVGDILDEHQFRLVREHNPSDPERRSEILGKLEYTAVPIREQLQVLAASSYLPSFDYLQGGHFLNDVLEKFYVIPKVVPPHTVSGE